MKKIIIIIISSLSCFKSISQIAIYVNDKTKHKFTITGNQNLNCSKCILCTGEQFNYFVTNEIDQKTNPNLVGNNFYLNCGVSGKINFESEEYNRQYKGSIYYNKPYVGDDEMRFSIDLPFRLTLVSTNESGDPTFDIEGGPDEITNTTTLPPSGTRTLEEYLTIKDGNPTMPQGVGLSQYFDVAVSAPIVFSDELDGNYTYNGAKGKFSGAQNVGKVTYIELPQTGKDRNIKILIANLPDNIPLIPTFNMKAGLVFPEPDPKPAEAFVSCGATPLPNGNTSSTALLPRYTVWFDEVSTNHFQLMGGYACPDLSKNSTAAPSSSGMIARKQWVVNPADWQNKRSVIFTGRSTRAIQYNSIKLKQVGKLKQMNVQQKQ